jgi:polar amino acid transport system ATP-binding protein
MSAEVGSRKSEVGREDGAPASQALLRIEGLYKAYDQHLVLKNINLAVDEHEVVCLIGASGCGKSTLLRCINLLEEINAGAIYLGDELITREGIDADRVRQRIGLVFQSFNLFPHMSVLENIILAPTKALGMGRREATEAALELLARFGLEDKAREYPDRLSGGQQQRVAIIRALALNPRVLLLDEVTSALDPEMVGEVLNVIAELKGLGMTMILATHQMGFAYQIADRVAFLEAGAILEEGPARRMLGEPEHPRTRQFLQQVLAAAPIAATAAGPEEQAMAFAEMAPFAERG